MQSFVYVVGQTSFCRSFAKCFLCPLSDDMSTGSLPLVNISASVSLSAADMTLYLKKMSRGEAVEGNLHTTAAMSHV